MDLRMWLNKPYPLLTSWRTKLLLILGFGIFVFLFLILFQPFGASDIKRSKTLFLLGFGVSVSLALCICYFILPLIFRSWFDPERWQIKKEILFLFCCFSLVALFNTVHNNVIGQDITNHRTYLEFFGISFAVGMFPLIILIFLVELFLNNRNLAQASQIDERRVEVKSHGEALQIVIEPETSTSEVLRLPLDDFLFAASDNNYSTVYFFSEGQIQRELLRLSLKNLETQLKTFEDILRCHKSYLVNKSKITKISGNARSLVLQVEGYKGLIPVSRSFPKERLV